MLKPYSESEGHCKLPFFVNKDHFCVSTYNGTITVNTHVFMDYFWPVLMVYTAQHASFILIKCIYFVMFTHTIMTLIWFPVTHHMRGSRKKNHIYFQVIEMAMVHVLKTLYVNATNILL